MMKLIAVVLLALLIPGLVNAGDIQISVRRKQIEAGQKVKVGENTEKCADKWRMEVDVRNTGFKPLPALKARYMIFVQRQTPGSKPQEDVVEKVLGAEDVSAIAAQGSGTFSTKEIVLNTENLFGPYHYVNGGRIKTKDNILGVWIKLFDGDKEVAQMANPTTLPARNKWKDPKADNQSKE